MSYIRSHELAKDLQSRPDGFITATINGTEYVIESFRRVITHANIDDSLGYWTLNLKNYDESEL